MTELKIFFNKEIGVFRKSCKPVYNFFGTAISSHG
ncbi:hypothetical protein LPC_0035 [Legionella pneumophila str. Corby]|nr:hypothetical protein LPC_0035 [Legionella pneumophila str. Corby]